MNGVEQIALGVPAERSGYATLLVILGVVFVATTGWFGYALATAPDATSWGYLVVNWMYVLGITQFGTAYCAIMRLVGAKWGRRFYRIGEMITLSFLPFAFIGFLLIYRYGGEHLYYWLSTSEDAHLSPWLSAELLLYRNLLGQLLFYGLALFYFLKALGPDIPPGSNGQGPALRRALFGWAVALNGGRSDEDTERSLYYWAPIVLIGAVTANTLISWDFGMMLVPHYHSTVFPLYYILGNMYAGAGAILVIAALVGRFVNIDSHIKSLHLRSMAVLMTGFLLLWMYMFWAQFFVSWFGNLPNEYGVLSKQMYGHYGPVFWAMIACNFAIPLSFLLFVKIKEAWWSMVLVCFVVMTGIWLNRYLIVMPALSDDHQLFSSFTELTMGIAVVSGFLFVLLLFLNAVPVVSTWEKSDPADLARIWK